MSNEIKKQLINKQSIPQFNCSLRFGISSQDSQELHSLINCLKLLESSEVKIRKKENSPTKIDEVSIPS